jgi:NAD(P)-dependent dehydrogenase (short-subunit alcohol dehydrogenase family)
VGSVAGIVETTEEDWNCVVATNLTGVWLCMKYEIPEMLKRGRGAIVNNGSVTGLVGSPGVVGNVASKHGVTGLTKSAALQYATQGIRVNAVAPGLVRTPTAERIKALHPDAEKAMLSAVPQGRWCDRRRSRRQSSFCARKEPRTLLDTSCQSTEAGRHADNLPTLHPQKSVWKVQGRR